MTMIVNYKPVETEGAFDNNYIDWKIAGDRYINLSFKEYLGWIRSHIGEFVNILKDSSDSSDTFNQYLSNTLKDSFVAKLFLGHHKISTRKERCFLAWNQCFNHDWEFNKRT